MAEALDVRGLINVQYAVKQGQVFVIEANPRASRTVPFVAKATGRPAGQGGGPGDGGRHAGRAAGRGPAAPAGGRPHRGEGGGAALQPLPRRRHGARARDALDRRGDGHRPHLRPGLRQGQISAGDRLPDGGMVFLSLADRDKAGRGQAAAQFVDLGFAIAATDGTADHLERHGVPVAQRVAKVMAEDGAGPPPLGRRPADRRRPHRRGKVALVVNSPRGRGARADGAYIRRAANVHRIPCLTTAAAGLAAAEGTRRPVPPRPAGAHRCRSTTGREPPAAGEALPARWTWPWTVGSVTLPNPVMTASGTAGPRRRAGALPRPGIAGRGGGEVAARRAVGRQPAAAGPRDDGRDDQLVGPPGPGGGGVAGRRPAAAAGHRGPGRGLDLGPHAWTTTGGPPTCWPAPPEVVAVEVNLSCPNTEAGRDLFAHSAAGHRRVLSATAGCGRPRWAKLSPNVGRPGRDRRRRRPRPAPRRSRSSTP